MLNLEAEKTKGHLHPITILSRQMIQIFLDLGFTFVESPELESEKYNFDTLNFPKDHPARDMQDTFWIKDKPGFVLRTHVSNTQVRHLEKFGAPTRIVYFGRVFRSEATDATHEAQFYQLECLVVDKASNVANMKGMLEAVFQKLTGERTKLRIRPSFFPFVEPGFEIDLTCFKCWGAGVNATTNLPCATCKTTGWIEMGGAGMVHPAVLSAGGVDPAEYRGFAFGLGFDRMVMLKYGIEDIRHLYSGDLRFVNQF